MFVTGWAGPRHKASSGGPFLCHLCWACDVLGAGEPMDLHHLQP